MDLGQSLGLQVTPGVDARIVVVATGEASSAGLLVDAVNEVITLRNEDIEPAPASDTEILGSIARVGERLMMLLDADRIFEDIELDLSAS